MKWLRIILWVIVLLSALIIFDTTFLKITPHSLTYVKRQAETIVAVEKALSSTRSDIETHWLHGANAYLARVLAHINRIESAAILVIVVSLLGIICEFLGKRKTPPSVLPTAKECLHIAFRIIIVLFLVIVGLIMFMSIVALLLDMLVKFGFIPDLWTGVSHVPRGG